MAQTPSIPEALHTQVINWWLTGLSPREVRDRLRDEEGVVTSHTSVQRLVNQVADGHGSEALLATVTRLRLRSTALMDQLEENLTRLRVEAGLEEPSAETTRRGLLDLRLFDLTDRITIRHLRLAGIGGRTGEQLVEKYEAQQRQLGDARCAVWGVTWPFQAPVKESATEETPATPPLVAEASHVSSATTLPPVSLPPEPALPGTPAASAADSVRMAALPSALEADRDAYALDSGTPALPTPEVIPTNIAPRRPCPCGSGLRFKHCHGKLQSPPVSEPAPLSTRNAA